VDLPTVAIYVMAVVFFGLWLVVLPVFVFIAVLRRGWAPTRQRPLLRAGVAVLALFVFALVVLVTWGPVLAVYSVGRQSDDRRESPPKRRAFADGHVQWLPRKKNPDGTWAKQPDADVRWEVDAREPEE
jgi:hypothetical protein